MKASELRTKSADELKAIQDRVAATRAAEDVLLREQKGLETRLFAAQQEVGQTLDAIFALEQQLEARERSALPGGGATPKAEPKTIAWNSRIAALP